MPLSFHPNFPQNFPRLPALPDNAQYLRTELCTNTWGAIDAVRGALPLAQHEYIMVVDSTVRGPFLPPYMSDSLHWTEAFTSRITTTTKLVGSMISCEGAPAEGNAAGQWRANPHVLSSAWATDSEGWRVLAAEPGVVRCHAKPWDARYHSNVGSSLAILNAGYSLDCLLTRYQGVDWTNTATWNCNQRSAVFFFGSQFLAICFVCCCWGYKWLVLCC